MAQRIRRWLRRKDRRQDPDGTTFPPELWSEIISTSLPLKDIRTLSECSKFLRNVSIPFLFKTLTIHPLAERVTYSSDFQWPPYFQIPNYIAQVIETVAILPKGTRRQDLSLNVGRGWVDGTDLPWIFGLLSTLSKLRHLVCDRVPFTQDLLNKLVQLPLKRLELSDCVMSSTPITVKVAGTLESVNLCFPPGDPQQGRVSLARILLRDSPNLTSIYLEDDVMFSMMVSARPPSLTSLNIPAEYINDSDFVDVLTTCSSLKSLSLRGVYYTGTSVVTIPILPHGTLPKLERYGGPFDVFPSFTNDRPSVKELYLIFPSGFGPLPTLFPGIPTSIESVTCSFFLLDPLFALLHASFASGSLTRLTMISPEWSLDRLPQLLTTSNLAPLTNIRYFTLRSPYDITRPNSPSDLSQVLQKSLSALLEVYPNLEEARMIPVDSNWESKFAMVWTRRSGSSRWLLSRDLKEIDRWWKD
ncbi:hypothetical protein BDN72DRAFT_841091 [Pluteus cervinus]|uniref:Uncharacterized protein n=1 Tax=Pluteus cervinus TaxID=181527 RepID=A0ACD3AVM3_9AGAR|nr:hypothetical protein BDN72DRAFT_841091 [Pluteus cervinus]